MWDYGNRKCYCKRKIKRKSIQNRKDKIADIIQDDIANDNTQCSPPDTGDSILQKLFTDAVVGGPDLPQRLAQTVTRHWSNSITKADYDAMGEVPLPGNLSCLQTPIIKDQIWTKMPQESKSVDNRIQNEQNNQQKAALLMLKL